MARTPRISHAGREVALITNEAADFSWSIAAAAQAALALSAPGVTARLARTGTPWHERLHADRLTGIIGFLRPDDLEKARQLGVPAVNYATEMAQHAPSVLTDHEAIGAMGAAHLIERGYRRFTFIAYRQEHFADQRFAGFHGGISQAGGQARFLHWDGNDLSWLTPGEPEPLAIMTAGDWSARRLCETLVAAGFDVPGHVAVMGVNNESRLCEMSPVPLTSVDIDPERIGRVCVERLLHLAEGGRPWQNPVLIPPRGIAQRASTDVLAFPDPNVRIAMRFIHDHLGESIQVADIMEQITISRRTLEMRFREQVGQSIHEAIERQRFAFAQRLLRDTDLPVGQIAFRCGYPKHSRFTALFGQRFNTTPTAYRARYRA